MDNLLEARAIANCGHASIIQVAMSLTHHNIEQNIANKT